MEIRKIKPEENVAASMIRCVSFTNSQDFTEKLKNPLEHITHYEQNWGAFNGEGKLCSCVRVIPYQVRFDGNTAAMGGIGGVASLPEERNSSYVKHIFKAFMYEMKEKGEPFSYLYPFSHYYYRKFGYELCNLDHWASIPVEDFKFPQKGSLEFYNKADDLTPYKEIYTEFIKDKNLAVVRSDEIWTGFIEKDPYSTKQYTYIWKNEAGEYKSYVIFTHDRVDNQNIMKVAEFAWKDIEGMQGMLGNLINFRGHYKNFVWSVPNFVNVHALLDEPYCIDLKTKCGGMNRIIDVEKALPLVLAPKESGSVVLDITDDFLPFNQGVYEMEWESGNMSVKRSTKQANMSLSVMTLAQLACGFISPEEAMLAGKADIKSHLDILKSLFPKKALYIGDKF